jgi:hypothetical protein
MKNVLYEHFGQIKILDRETGEIKETQEKRVQTIKVDDEPNYVKLYLEDICQLNELPKTSSKLLNELLKLMDYKNRVLLPSGIKKEIANNLSLSVGTLNNDITKLIKKGIIKRESTGVYLLNPHYFGKGKWQDIKEIRAVWTYSKNGRKLENIEVV